MFLLLLVPSMVLASVARTDGQTFPLAATATILHDLGLTAIALFFVWSDGERLPAVGWTSRRLPREIGLGVLLYIPMVVLLVIISWLIQEAGLDLPKGPPVFLVPRSLSEIVLAIVLVAVVAIAEETIFRGYLILRLRAVTRSTTAAVVLSCLVFASGHLYEGGTGVVAVGVMGIVFALVYLWRKSLVAPIVMHFLQDLLGLVLIPLLR